MFDKMKENLKKVDLFGQSITLNFRQEECYTTSFGGSISICIVALIVSFFYSNIIDFFNMTEVQFTTSTKFEKSPGNILLSRDQFMFAVQIEQPDFITSPYFNISVEQRHYRRENGTQIRLPNIYIDMVPCTLEHFSKVFNNHDANVSIEFMENQLNNFLCPSQESLELIVGGVWLAEDYYFFKVSVTACNSVRNDNFTWQPICKSDKEINDHLMKYGNFRFQIYTTNYLINPQESDQFIQPYLASDLHFIFVPGEMFVEADIFFRSKAITTDNGILMYPSEETLVLGVREQGDMREQFNVKRLTPGYHAAFYLQRSPFSQEINRSFTKLDDLLSYLGGFLQFVVVILGTFVSFYNKQHMIISMANDLYEFRTRSNTGRTTFAAGGNKLLFQTQQGIEILQTKRTKTQTIQVPEQLPFQSKPIMQQTFNDIQDISHIPLDTKAQCSMRFCTVKTETERKKRFSRLKSKSTQYLDQFKNFILSQSQVGLSIRYILCEWLNTDYFMDEESSLLKKATMQIQQELDIGYILKQMYELAKLKKVLFSQEQTTLFEFSHKPVIMLYRDIDQRKSIGKLLTEYRKEGDNEILTQFNELVNSYRTITAFDVEQMTDEQKRFNHRLVVLIGRELASIIEQEIANYESDESCVEVEDCSPDKKKIRHKHG